MSHIQQAAREHAGQCTLAGADSILVSMVSTLERTLPPAARAACDAILGPEASLHERWTMYTTAEWHHRHKREIEQVLTEVFHE